ncbi:14370_t:CDS:2 [Funneliformis mosseae]|uniref:14370_t:CDS:1 n=1 Tax=Funneliformis mosseae TaxID=27381 RepID=A0A9N9ADW6_FUNMO|nr:14370_t:CDS:2 [Funneliformis mosseae]
MLGAFEKNDAHMTVRIILFTKKVDGKKVLEPLADIFNQQDSLVSVSVAGKKRSIGQWHLEQVFDDGDYHHFYRDLTIKKHDSLHPEALLELLAITSISKLNGHFEQVFKHAERLCPQEV